VLQGQGVPAHPAVDGGNEEGGDVVTFSAAINACATVSAKLARRCKEEDASSGVHGNINIDSDGTIAGLDDGKARVGPPCNNGGGSILKAPAETGAGGR
jgi:hypothetical protein